MLGVLPILLLLLSPPAWSATVTLDGARWAELQPAPPIAPERRRPHATERDVELRVGEDRVLVHATWRIDPGDATWFAEPVIGFDAAVEGLRWNGRPAHAHAVRRGYLVLERLDGPATLELWASVPRTERPLELLPATRGHATLTGEDLELGGGAVPLGEGWQLGGGPLVLRAAPPPTPDGSLTDAHVGVGLTVEDGVVAGRARLELVPRRGAIESVSFEHEGLGADLRVTGVDVASVDYEGSRVRVSLRSALSRRVQLDLRWTTTLADADEASLALPSIRPLSVHRTESSLQLARSGEREVVPSVRGQAIASRDLPDWGQGLVAGQASAAFVGSPRGQLELLRFQPADAPPAIVDVAEYTAATTAEGRALIKARYAVRADRAAALTIRPPPNATLLAVRVDGRTQPPSVTDDGAWRVPLPRSVESVDGLVSFPVELAWLQQDAPWGRREERPLPLPSVDAPVAVQRATVYLPPGFAALRAADEDRRVSSFSRGGGIRYGFALDADGDHKKDVADSLFGSAVNAWKSNDFDEAQAYMDELGKLGAANEDVSRLQSNLDVIEGKEGDRGVATRRVLEQAKARGKKKRQVYDERLREAEERSRAGDYAAAEKAAEAALVLGGELEKLEQSESVDLEAANSSLRAQLRRPAAAAPAQPAPPPVDSPASSYEARDESVALVVDGTAALGDLYRLGLDASGLDKFDYGDPDVDQWAGRGGAVGYSGFGSRGSGSGGGGVGYGMGRGLVAKAPVVVLASTRSVPIPRLGDALLFQRLLLPAGVLPTLPLRARRVAGDT